MRSEDFPPNVDMLTIEQLTLYFAGAPGNFEVSVDKLIFTQKGSAVVGGGATSTGGVVSTRRGNAANWSAMIGKRPVGTWRLKLAETLPDGTPTMKLFAAGDKNANKIDDILFVVSYRGQTPKWPS